MARTTYAEPDTVAAEIGAIVRRDKTEIYAAWVALLRRRWGAAAEDKLRLLDRDRRAGCDLFTLTLGILTGKSVPSKRNLDALIGNVRRLDYSITDLFAEFSCLEEALGAVLRDALDERTLDRFMHGVRGRIKELFAAVLAQTAAVYEAVTETGGRGYCEVDDGGTITFANREMHDLLGVAAAEGVNLADAFGSQREFVLQAVRAPHGGAPGVRRLELMRPDGRIVAVNAGIAPLWIDGERRGGYAVLTDITSIIESELRIFERSPLGILKINDRQQITYANDTLLEIFGTARADLKRLTIWDLVPDPSNRRVLEEQLKHRAKGLSDGYEVEITRPGDGRRVPVSITAMPEFDNRGTTIGSLGIVRSLELERARDAIHRAVETRRDAAGLLGEVTGALRNVLPFDLFTVSVLSRDTRHARVLFSQSDEAIRWNMRWHPISKGLADWMHKEPGPLAEGDFPAFVRRPEMQELQASPDIQDLLKAGYRSFLRHAIIHGGKVTAVVSLMSRRPSAYVAQDCARFAALPIEKAVQMALHYGERAEEGFRHRLLRKLSGCRSSRKAARVLVDRLARHHRWRNVAVFEVDKARGLIRLRAQAAPEEHGFDLPEGYTQELDRGVLGHVYRTGEAVNIGNVRTDPKFSPVFVQASHQQPVASELCLPVRIGGEIRWLLNIEDERENAFSEEEKRGLQGILREVETILQNLFNSYTLEEVIAAASNLIVITDDIGHILQLNPAAEDLLGLAVADANGRCFADFFCDAEMGRFAVKAAKLTPQEVELRRADGGGRVRALLSGRRLAGELGRKVFFAADLSVRQRLEELETIRAVSYEIATQTRTPLSLIASWLRRLRSVAPEATETLDKALQQIRKIGITYDRLLLYDASRGVLPHDPVRLDIGRVLAEALKEFPAAERASIGIRVGPTTEGPAEASDGFIARVHRDGSGLPRLRGDPYRLTFMFQTVISYLMRFLPPEERVVVELSAGRDDGALDIAIKGFIPPPPADADEGGPASRPYLARARTDVALGEGILRRFIAEHGGEYIAPDLMRSGNGRERVFRIRLPVGAA